MANKSPSHSIAVDQDVYEAISKLAGEAQTTLGSVASAILRLGLPYYQNRWKQFMEMYPEMSRNGPAARYTPDRPTSRIP